MSEQQVSHDGLRGSAGLREPTRLQWQRYRNSYIGALHAAMRMLDELWEGYAKVVDNLDSGMEEVIECENSTTDACCEAMREDSK